MPKLEWLDTFELGVPEIDSDHRAMLDLMKAIHAAAQAGHRQRCEQYLERLLVLSRSHFDREEDLLRLWDYADIGRHSHYHARLLERVKGLKKVCVEIESPDEFKNCCDEMMDVLVDDVVRGDLRLKSFIQEKGVSLPI